MESVQCVTPDGITFYSETHSDRCAKEVLFGFAMYIKDGVNGIHKGITDNLGAFQWLAGVDHSKIKCYKVY